VVEPIRRKLLSPWTAERDAALIRMRGEGLSSSQIAKQFGNGISRNSVIGRAMRLGLASPAKRPYVTRTHPRQPKAKPLPKPEPIMPEPEPIDPNAPIITILTVTNRQCKFITSHDDLANAPMCGRATDGGPYCAHHRFICWQPMQPRRADRAA